MRSHLIVTALGLVALSASTAEPQAQRTYHRCLNGFRFIPSSLVDDHSRRRSSRTRLAAVNLEIPVRNLRGDRLTTLSGNIGFLLVDFEFQQAIAKWLALRVSAGGIGRLVRFGRGREGGADFERELRLCTQRKEDDGGSEQ